MKPKDLPDTGDSVKDDSERSPKQDAIDTIKTLRGALEAARGMAEALRGTDEGKQCARELSLCITEAQSARHWAGECLGILDPSSRSKA